MIACGGAFIPSETRTCSIEIEGVAGNLEVRMMGTAELVVVTDRGKAIILRLANSLLSRGHHSLVGLAHIQMNPKVKVSLTNEDPNIKVGGHRIPLQLQGGTYVLPFSVVSDNDPRRSKLPVVPLSLPGRYVPPTFHHPDGSVVWKSTARAIVPAAYVRRRLKTPLRALVGFRERVAALSDSVFIDSTTRPQAHRHYAASSPTDMEKLSTRFVGTSTGRLKQTIKVSNGLTERKGVVQPNRFPQGTLTRNKTPRVFKNIVHHLHEASVAECVYTDTFETDDVAFHHGQAFVCYKSRFGAVFPIQSRKMVVQAFRQFCADVFTPLILIRDNISENTGKELMRACREVKCQSGFSTPYMQQQDFAEGFIRHVCRLAAFGMVYSGAPMFLWRYAILSAVFIYNITAGWYSKEDMWATPYELVYGEPFPDSSIVVPFGCAALILLRFAAERQAE